MLIGERESSTAPRSTPPDARAPLPSSPPRLALCELLLRTDDVPALLRGTLDWMSEHIGVSRALAFAIDPEARRTFAPTAAGLDDDAAAFELDLRDPDDPLVEVLRQVRPIYFAPEAAPTGPLGGVAFHAIPLHAHDDRPSPAAGLLLAPARGPELDREVAWCARMLGKKLGRLGARQAFARGGPRRERRVLYCALDAVPDPVLVTDGDGRMILSNAHADRLLATVEGASEGRCRAVAMNNMLLSAAISSRVVGHGHDDGRAEVPLVDPDDGSDLLFELMLRPIDDASEGRCVVSVLRNVTDLGRAHAEVEVSYGKLRSAEAEVSAERRRLKLIIDSVADPIIATDPAGDIVFMNGPAATLFLPGRRADKAARRRVAANDAHFSSFVSSLLFSDGDQTLRGELTLIAPATGEALPMEAVAGKIVGGRGDLDAVVTILHDRREALERARLYAQLETASQELAARVQAATAELVEQNEVLRRQRLAVEQASAAKSQFLANVSHELRTPLNAILGYAQMLREGIGGPLAPLQHKYLTRVDANSQHLLAIINECLDITRIEAGRMPVQRGPVDVVEVVREVVAELEPIVARAGLPIQLALPARAPTLRSDRQKVKQIVLNLVSNALKFTHAGHIRITVANDAASRRVSVAVADTGIGIAPEDHERVFEDFRQVDSSLTRAYAGTGLGLGICRRLAALLGGRITLESEPGRGSTFTLQLPLRPHRSAPRRSAARGGTP
jgi:signal transduction histidine kinase/PAS domain-containing protein